jgi:hypothetical protein
MAVKLGLPEFHQYVSVVEVAGILVLFNGFLGHMGIASVQKGEHVHSVVLICYRLPYYTASI